MAGSFHAYIPSRFGFPISLELPKTTDLSGDYQTIDLGHVRVKFKATASGYVGVSVAASANLNLTVKQLPGEKQAMKLKGNNKPSPTTHYNSHTDEKADVNAFAGAKVSGDVGASIDWKNPEKNVDAQQQLAMIIEGKPRSALSSLQQAAAEKIEEQRWCEFASLDAGGSAALGIGAGLGFSIGFNHNLGKFYINAHKVNQLLCNCTKEGRARSSKQ